REAGIRGVRGEAALKRVDAGLASLPRGDVVGLAHAERDGVRHAGRDVEEPPDPRRRAVGDHRVERFHGLTCRRWSASAAMNSSSSSLYVRITKCVTVSVTRSIVDSLRATKSAISFMLPPVTMQRRSCAPETRYTERTSGKRAMRAATSSN